MALASQTIRNPITRRGPGESRRSPWIWVAAAAGCLGLAGIVWWQVEDRLTPAAAHASDTPAAPAKPAVPVQRFDVPGAAATPAVGSPRMTATPRPTAVTPSAPSVARTTANPAGSGSLRNAATPAGAGMKLIEAGKLVEGRAALSDVLVAGQVSSDDAEVIRETLASVNQRLVFSKEVVTGDPFAKLYTIETGDRLTRLANNYKVPHKFVEQINGIADASKIPAGRKIKFIEGPFHAVIHKSDFRLDLFLAAADGKRVYVSSYPVGLGESNSTPEGSFVIKPGGKVQGGGWTNPRTGETFSPGDPKNPIGKFWMTLQGADARTQNVRGYGIHGTIQPESIGQQMSMGCIRMHDEDIEQVYKMLFEGKSTVEIVP